MRYNRLRTSVAAVGGLTMAVLIGMPSADARPAPPPALAGPQAATETPATGTPLSAAPRLDVRTPASGTAPGLMFLTAQDPGSPAPHGPEIVDNQGRPVWFRPLPPGQLASDLRVQHYQGKRVLTWWEGKLRDGSHGVGTWYIADQNYRVIGTVQGVAERADLHDFRLTPSGTALITEYRRVPRDLSGVGGPKDGMVLDNVIEEVDVATGEVLMRWSSLDHVPVDQSDLPAAGLPQPFDYFHLNSVDIGPDGNLLVSARHLSTVFKIDRHTGKILWRLGGRNSSFPLGVGVRFSWQHDAEWAGRNLVKIFDNGAMETTAGYESRVVWVRIDPRTGTSEFVRQSIHPEHLSATREGGAKELPNGNTIVSWGPAARISEFSRNGKLRFDAALPENWSSYRIYRFPWQARPSAAPTATVRGDSVHAVWNGATEVQRWRLLAGPTPKGLKQVADAAWSGLDTGIRLPGRADGAKYVQVQALDSSGGVLASSAAVPR